MVCYACSQARVAFLFIGVCLSKLVVNGDFIAIPHGSYFMALLKQTIKDFVTGDSTDIDYNYDNLPQFSTNYSYLLPTKVTTKNYTTKPSTAIGTKVTTTVFDNNPLGVGADSHIGRPIEVTSTTSEYN